VDECAVHAHPYLAKVWRRKGQPLKVPAAGDDHKFAVFGAVDSASGQVIWQTSACKGETACMALLDHRVATLPQGEPAVLVLDNASDHKSHAVRAHCQRLSDRLQPFFLPAYAPQRNLIERLWRYLKAQLACHRWWNDLHRLIQATGTLLADLEVHFHAHDGRPAFRPAHNLGDSA
jgi:transposase InsO family protein